MKVIWCEDYMTYQIVVAMETIVFVAPAEEGIRS